ncbi:hypothetical protein CHUAL_001677 [Chamberlinius hualienensis]
MEKQSPSTCEYTDAGFSPSRTAMFDVLRSLIINNIEYYEVEKSQIGQAFSETFSRFLINLNDVEQHVNEISRFAHEYDYDRSVPGNGYRGTISVVNSCVLHSTKLCRTICLKRSSFVFRTVFYFKELEAFCNLMGCILSILRLMIRLRETSEPHQLFSTKVDNPVDILYETDNIDTTYFNGRCLGFQFHDSLTKPLKFIAILMASFSDAYYNTGGMVARTASSVISCGKYICSPELRARRIVEVARKASVDFCKSFWLLQEHQLVQQVPFFVCVSLAVNKVIQIPVQPLQITSQNGVTVDIPIPHSHLPPSPVICRLLSGSLREGQVSEDEYSKFVGKVKPPSPYLVIQCHGGGFVAQSSKSHEVYLRDWCMQLDVPFLCIDYSLSPDAPYPRALEECFYAYAWALNNCHKLGSTGEVVCVVGDSAGGTLLTGVIIKSIEFGIRKPDGFLSIYTPFLFKCIPSPSRVLCLMDPLLPFGFMMRCMKAYAGINNGSENNSEKENNVNNEEAAAVAANGNVFFDSPKLTDDCLSKDHNIATDVHLIKSLQNSFQKCNNEDEDPTLYEKVDLPGWNRFHNSDVSNNTETSSEVVNGDEENGNVDSEKSGDYVGEFLKLCKFDGENVEEKESAELDENVLFEMPVQFPCRLSKRMSKLTDRVIDGITNIFSNGNKSNVETKNRQPNNRRKSYNGIFVDRSLDDAGSLVTLLDEFKKYPISSEDYYLSPYYAPDDVLRDFPPVSFFCCTLDPCLDDSIMFSKKLKALGCKMNVDVLDHLPHGFLNLCIVSKDAKDGSDLALERLKNLLKMSENDVFK